MFYINNEIKSGIGHDGPNVDVSKLIEAYKWKFGKVTSGEKLILQSLSAQLGAGDPFNPEEYSKVFSGSKMSCMSGIKKTAYAASALGIGFFAALSGQGDMVNASFYTVNIDSYLCLDDNVYVGADVGGLANLYDDLSVGFVDLMPLSSENKLNRYMEILNKNPNNKPALDSFYEEMTDAPLSYKEKLKVYKDFLKQNPEDKNHWRLLIKSLICDSTFGDIPDQEKLNICDSILKSYGSDRYVWYHKAEAASNLKMYDVTLLSIAHHWNEIGHPVTAIRIAGYVPKTSSLNMESRDFIVNISYKSASYGFDACGAGIADRVVIDNILSAYNEVLREGNKDTQSLDKMIVVVDDIIEADPKNEAAWYTKGNILLMNKDYKGAVDSYSKVKQLDPKNTHRMLAEINYACFKGLSDNNDLALKSRCLLEKGKPYEVINVINEALALNPKDKEAWALQKRIYKQL